MSTTATHLAAIGYAHRVRYGFNPIVSMAMAQLMIKGLIRAVGPTARNLLFTPEDLRAPEGMMHIEERERLIG